MRYFFTTIIASMIALSANGQSCKNDFAKGADISWITQIEHLGKYRLVDDDGKEIHGFQMLKNWLN